MLPQLKLPKKYKDLIKIGTSSWKYDSWKDLIYQPEKYYQAYDYLNDYAKYYNTVEIDQWFWSLFPAGVKLPDPDAVKIYADSVPDDFLFTVKAPNSITLTNYYTKQPAKSKSLSNKPNDHFLDVDLLQKFIKLLKPMGIKLGPVMFQFEYLNKLKMPSLQAFIDKLQYFFAQAPKGIEYAIEIRNPNFLKANFIEFLKEHQVGLVLLEGYFMPPIQQVASQLDIGTANFSIIRLQGTARQEMEERTNAVWNQIIEPKEEGLLSTASIVKQNVKRGVRSYINVNNHYEGSAPITIQRLIEKL